MIRTDHLDCPKIKLWGVETPKGNTHHPLQFPKQLRRPLAIFHTDQKLWKKCAIISDGLANFYFYCILFFKKCNFFWKNHLEEENTC